MLRLFLTQGRPKCSSRPLLSAMLICGLWSPSLQGQEPDDISLFIGAAGGLTHIVPESGDETSKNGYHILASGFAELTHGQWIWQLGGGFFYNRVYSDGEKEFAGSQPSTVREQRNLRIETRAGEAEIASRYRLGLGLEAGLVLRSMFGASLSFSQEKDSKSAKFFGGPQAVLRLGEGSDWLQRVDISLTTDLNVPEKRVYLLTAGFALGTPVYKREPKEVIEDVNDRFEEILADKVINFPSGSAELKGPALSFLQDLGRFLKSQSGIWRRVEIEGHTDKKGRLAYNMQLSKDRAEVVRKILIEQGAEGERIKAEGFGPTRPLLDADTPEALAANRRVVMIFNVQGRDERNKLSAFIKELRKKYFNE